MKRLKVHIIGGVLLIAAGILFLLQNFGVLTIGTYVWPVLFGIGGLVFLYVFLTSRANWWAIIPGLVLLSLAAVSVLDQFAPQFDEDWGGAIFLGGIGLAFWMIYFVKHEHWWAIIPGGALFTLALVTGLSSVLEGVEVSGVFFWGLG